MLTLLMLKPAVSLSLMATLTAVTLAPFSLRAMVDEAVGLFEDEARTRGLQLQVQVDAAVPERVLGDALRTRQILVNLLSNAMKFTRRGQVAVSAGKRMKL